MSALDDFFEMGTTVTLGSHTFSADEIKEFARKYDPQPFHLDEEAARSSVFGGLCASGWHSCAMWMRYNLESGRTGPGWKGEGRAPEFGPSPGFTDLKWLKPVYAGDTITFTRRATGHRPIASRPGWRLLTIVCEGFNQSEDKVFTFDSAVLVKAA
jgi:acyl dehydratase